MFQKIAAAIGFSPRSEALLYEIKRFQVLFSTDVIIIHVGEKTPEKVVGITNMISKTGFQENEYSIVWTEGEPSREILLQCKKFDVDLLIAGALRKENLMDYYLGSVARKILRKASCSVLMLVNPSTASGQFNHVVISGEGGKPGETAIKEGCELARSFRSRQIHITRELKLYGLAMAVSSERPEDESSEIRKQLVGDEIVWVEEILSSVNKGGLKINIKVLSGKSGYELAKFVKKVKADLLIVGAPTQKLWFFDRVFTHDLEYIFQNLPSNLLIINKK